MINIQYLYPDEENPENLVIFQDANSQIIGLKFKRNRVDIISKRFEKFDFVQNSCIYFLMEGETVYIGKSTQGVKRINNHVYSKSFWEYALMFVTDNNTWTSTIVDYLEYHYINQFKKLADYTLENIEPRNNIPNITIYDKANLEQTINKIDFYLNISGINISKKHTHTENLTLSKYYSKDKKSSIVYNDGYFYLQEGSQLTKPKESVKKYSDSGALYDRLNKTISDLVDSGLVDAETLVAKQEIEVKSISRAASLVCGRSVNGWEYFVNSQELRNGKK